MTASDSHPETPAGQGLITRVNGPVVEASGMGSAQMYEVVEVGPPRLIGEVIKVDGGVATIQTTTVERRIC